MPANDRLVSLRTVAQIVGILVLGGGIGFSWNAVRGSSDYEPSRQKHITIDKQWRNTWQLHQLRGVVASGTTLDASGEPAIGLYVADRAALDGLPASLEGIPVHGRTPSPRSECLPLPRTLCWAGWSTRWWIGHGRFNETI